MPKHSREVLFSAAKSIIKTSVSPLTCLSSPGVWCCKHGSINEKLLCKPLLPPGRSPRHPFKCLSTIYMQACEKIWKQYHTVIFSPEEDSDNVTTISYYFPSTLYNLHLTFPHFNGQHHHNEYRYDRWAGLYTRQLNRLYVNFPLSIKDVKKTRSYATSDLTVRDERKTVAFYWPSSSTDRTVFVLGAHSNVKRSWIPAVCCK